MITPDPKDFEKIERERGPLPANAMAEEILYRYQLAQAAKLIREQQEAS
jgi:hypothetical protein